MPHTQAGRIALSPTKSVARAERRQQQKQETAKETAKRQAVRRYLSVDHDASDPSPTEPRRPSLDTAYLPDPHLGDL